MAVVDLGTKPSRRNSANGTEVTVHPLPTASHSKAGDRRAWSIKGICPDTVSQSRKAARTQGMLLSLWVEKQLREAAERELNGSEAKVLAAEIMCAKIDNIESSLKEYLEAQDKQIALLQKEVRQLSNKIVPPLLKALSAERPKKTA